jgi:hypothetical protein
MFLSFRHGSRFSMRTVRRPKTIAGSMLCAATIALASCGSGPSKVAASSTLRSVSSTTTTLPPTGAAALALTAYRGMWTDMVLASRTSNYQSPLLPQHASGTALSTLVQGLAKNQQAGIVTKGKPQMNPQVTSFAPIGDPTQVTVTDCFSDVHWLDYKRSGGLVDSTPGGRHATSALVIDLAGTWKVTELAIQQAGTC